MSSSSLTSVSINKNKNRFAPKVKARPVKRPQVNDASSSTSSLPTKTVEDSNTLVKTEVNINIDSDTVKETIRRVSASTLPDITNLTESTVDVVAESINSTQKISQTSSTPSSSSSFNKRPSTSKRRISTAGTPIIPGVSSTVRKSTPIVPGVSSSTAGTSTSTSRRRQPMVIPEPSTPTPDDYDMDPTTPQHPYSRSPTPTSHRKPGQISQKNMMNIRDAMNKSSRPLPSSKPTPGYTFTIPSIRRASPTAEEVDELDDDDNADDMEEINASSARLLAQARMRARGKIRYRKRRVASDSEDEEMELKRRGRKKQEPIPAKDLKTLDDINTDPLQPGNLDRSMAYYIRDRPDGIVTKQFRDEQLQLELQREEERAMKKNDQDTLDRLAQQKQALQQKKESDDALVAKKAEEVRKRKEEQSQGGLTESSHALQVRMVDGKIVLDTDSMQIDRQLDHENISHEHMEVVEENAQSRKINSTTYGKKRFNARWTIEETELFYELLSQFGTDFEMISHMIPGRSRAQIRHKYSKEMKLNPKKVNEYMVHKRKPLDLESFKKATGLEFEKVPDNFHSMKLA